MYIWLQHNFVNCFFSDCENIGIFLKEKKTGILLQLIDIAMNHIIVNISVKVPVSWDF